jgi:hypothetical protein
MPTVRLGDLQRTYRARQKSEQHHNPRRYLIDGLEPSAATYQIVCRRLYAEGAIDNLGHADTWLLTATEAERATLFSDIATALLKA